MNFYFHPASWRRFVMYANLLFIFSFVAFMQVGATGYAQKITLNEREVSLPELFTEIRQQSQYDFFYNDKIVRAAHPVSIQVKNASIQEVLDRCLTGQNLQYTIKNKIVIIQPKSEQEAPAYEPPRRVELQQGRLSGQVSDAETGEGLPAVTVTLRSKDYSSTAMTDVKGAYQTSGLPFGTYEVTFTSVGYASSTQTINLSKNAEVLNVTLSEDVSQLDQVVVMAYGTSKVKDVTGSISSLGVEDMKQAPMGATVQSLLQGKASGVNVTIQSASPTSPISVIIRGASSLSGNNQPLWVIDGVPDYSSSTSGNIANSLYNLNLNDVQSIDILKDASATALYGSRAANGVVIVTTKKGVNGMKPTIEVSSRIGYQTRDFNDYWYMEAPQYIDFADKAAREEVFARGEFDYFTRLYLDEQAFFNLNTSEFDRSDLEVLPGAYYEGNTNWMDLMTHNPFSQQYDLSLRGGSESIAYYTSLYSNQQDGIVRTGGSTLYGGRLNFEAKLRDQIKFGLILSGSSRKTDDKDYMLGVLQRIRPDIPPYNPDGSLFTRDAYTENPYTTLLNTIGGDGQTFNGTGFLEYTIIDGLVLRSAYTANYTNGQRLSYYRRGSEFVNSGEREWENTKTQTNVWENTLTFANTYGKHDVLGLLGYSMENTNRLLYGMKASNFPDDDILNNFPAAADRGELDETYDAHALISQFARVHYKYNGRYIISGTLRRDGSSRFGPGKRWGVFPSVAAAWLVTEEDFIKESNISNYLSYLKVRASTGKAGSQNLGNYDWIGGIGSSRYNEQPAIAPNSIGNGGLQWEETRMTDIGLDFGFWNERIRGTFGIYRKLTDKLIYDKPLPPSSAYSSISANVASIKNQGVELDITVDALKKTDWLLSFNANASTNTNRVIKINDVVKELNFPNSYFDYIRVEAGLKTGQWYGFQTANRLFVTQEEIIALQSQTKEGAKQFYRTDLENPGDLYFIDQNQDGVIDDEDKTYLGTSEPKLTGGFGATVYYKNFRLNTTFVYAYGHQRMWKVPMDNVGYVGNYNQSNLIAGRSATLLGPYEASMPRMTQYGDGYNGNFSDFWLYDASYLRLNALNISYRLPDRLFNDKIINGIELTFQATNLFTLTKYPGFDPQGNWSDSEIGVGMGIDNSYYPSARNYNLGVRFTFK